MATYLSWLTTLYTEALGGATVKLMLLGHNSGGELYVQDWAAAHRSDVTDFEVTGTGYTAGGLPVTGLNVTREDGSGWVKIDFEDVDFGTITLDLDGVCAAVAYIDTGDASTDVLLGADVFTEVSVNGVGYTYVVSSDGFITAEAY